MQNKTSSSVKVELEKIFSEHGHPKLVQCDNGTEFKGAVGRMLQKRGIKVQKSRPYNPQAQGKCERSHREVRRKIHVLRTRKHGFNWARDLHHVQSALNNIPKEVLGNCTPNIVL